MLYLLEIKKGKREQLTKSALQTYCHMSSLSAIDIEI